MSEAIIVAIVGGVFSLLGVVLSNRKSAREIDHKLEVHQAVTDTKIEELTREVRKHNNFAEKLPVIQTEVNGLKDTVNDLKHYHMQ